MEKKLTVVEQKEVTFYDDELTTVRASDGQIYVSIRHMCDALGLNTQAQTRRIQRHNVLSDGYKGVAIMTTPSESGVGGGQQQAKVLRVDLVPFWLSTLDISRTRKEIRPKLERFQREAAKVLWEAFQEGRLTPDPTFEELLETDSQAVQAYKTFQALTKLARSQILLEGRMDEAERRIERIESVLGDTGHAITPEQASQISQAVKAVAMKLSDKTGRNEYGGVYGELYRRFGITSYKLLPKKDFDKAVQFLTDWHKRLTEE